MSIGNISVISSILTENRVIASTPLVENDSIETDYIDIPMSEQQSTSAGTESGIVSICIHLSS